MCRGWPGSVTRDTRCWNGVVTLADVVGQPCGNAGPGAVSVASGNCMAPDCDQVRQRPGRLRASRGNRDLFPVPHSQLEATSCPRRGREAASLQGQFNDACASLNWLAEYRLDSGERTKPTSPMQLDTIARIEGLTEMTQPTPGGGVVFRECF